MRVKAWLAWGAGVSSTFVSGTSGACGGGGVVSSQPGSIGANAQRVLLSVHLQGAAGAPTTTDVITQIGVPETTADYGVLLPLPSEPTLDPTPVAAEELDRLDEATAPRIIHGGSSSDGGGCGCLGATGGGIATKGGDEPGARVSEPVNIGPVTAVVLTGTTDAVNAWLADNGFSISAADQATVAAYSGYYFIAIRRNDKAAPGGATSIGIHFEMPGDHREVPLRFASLGAAPSVAFTLFLAVAELAGPSPPFAALTLRDLDADLLRSNSYAQAVQNAVRAHGNQAFVLESRTPREQLWGFDGTRIGGLIDRNATLTRMSTIVPAEALTEDAHFHTIYYSDVPSDRYVSAGKSLGSREASLGSLAALLVAGAWRRKRR